MSVSKVLNRWLNRLYKVVAILLVLSAVLISALRLMLPYAENYRLTFQNYLNDTYKINIVIGNLNAGWHKLGPSLVAENVNLLESKHASIFIDRIDFSIDFWSSIKARQFITNNFTLTGAKVFVQQGAFSSKSSNNNVATITRITDLFLTQVEHFSVKQSQIIVQTSQKKRHKLVINQLAWKNIAHRHHAQGDVVFGNLSAKNLKLQLNLTGNNQANLAGQIYLEGNNLDITPWLEKVLKIDSDQIDSSISFKSWLALKRGSAQTLQLQLGNNTINWQYQNVNHQLRLQQGDIAAQFIDGSEQFLLSSSPLNFSLDQQPWQPVVVQLSQKKSVLSAYLSSIQLQHISPLSPLFSNNKVLLEQLAAAKPSGRLHNIFLQKHKDFYDLAAEFDDISFAYNRGIPGIEHLSGDLLMSAGRLRLDLKAKQGQLDFDQHFIRPMPYQYLSATVNGVFDQTGWKIGTNNLVFNSAELKLTGQAGLVLPTKSATKLSLFAQLKDINVNNVKYYFPHLLMGEDFDFFVGLVSAAVDATEEAAQVF